MRSAWPSAVGVGAGETDGAAVGAAVGFAVGAAVGGAEGVAVGAGEAVGAGVGTGAAVGAAHSTLKTFCFWPFAPSWVQYSLYWPSGSEKRSGASGTRTSSASPELHVPFMTWLPPGCASIRHVPEVPAPKKKCRWNVQTFGSFAFPSDSLFPSWILTVPDARVAAEQRPAAV